MTNSENSGSSSEPRQKRKYTRRQPESAPATLKQQLNNINIQRATDPNSVSAMRDALLKEVYANAMSGQLGAVKEWLDWAEQQVPQEDFNITVKVVPYEIKDVSLKRIAAQADTGHVVEIFEGIELRLEQMEAPHIIRDLTRCLKLQYVQWADEAYANK